MKKHAQPLWHPKLWPSWLAIAIVALIVLLPLNWIHTLGASLGRLLHQLAKRRRHIAEVNIRLCYPKLSESEQAKLVISIFEENAIGFFEAFIAWLRPGKHIAELTINGKDVLDAALDKKKGVLLISAHYTHVDICGRLLEKEYSYNSLYRPQNNAAVNYVMEKGRNKFLEAPCINQHDLRTMVKTLKNGRILWFPFDQDHGPKSSVFAPFYGIEAATLTIPSRLKRLSDCEVVFCSHRRISTNHYIVDIKPIELNGEDLVADANAMNTLFENALDIEPAQYMWVHRKFKTRPNGEASVY